MLRIYICPNCYNLRMVSRKPDAICFHCGTTLELINVDYETYVNMTEEERLRFKEEYKIKSMRYKEEPTSAALDKIEK